MTFKKIDFAETKYANLKEQDVLMEVPEVPVGNLNLDVMYIRNVFFGMSRYFNLTPAKALLIATIHSLSEDGRAWCYMSQQHLADALNLSLTTVNTLLEELREEELLEKGARHKQWKSYQWRLAPKALDHMKYLQERIAKIKTSKRR